MLRLVQIIEKSTRNLIVEYIINLDDKALIEDYREQAWKRAVYEQSVNEKKQSDYEIIVNEKILPLI